MVLEVLKVLTILPQVHVAIHPIGQNVGGRSSRTAPHDEHHHSLDWEDVKSHGQDEPHERHDSKLTEEAHKDTPGPLDMPEEFLDFHVAAHREHHHSQEDSEHCAQSHAEDGVEIAGGENAGGTMTHGGFCWTLHQVIHGSGWQVSTCAPIRNFGLDSRECLLHTRQTFKPFQRDMCHFGVAFKSHL